MTDVRAALFEHQVFNLEFGKVIKEEHFQFYIKFKFGEIVFLMLSL